MSIHAHEPRSTTTRSIGLVGGLFLIGLASLSACDVGYKPLGGNGEGNGETGNGDGDGDNDGPEQELPGAALDSARYCPDLSAPPLQEFAGADYYLMGGCGDLLIFTDDNQTLLARIDGTTEQLGVSNKTAVLLSPRGRLVARESVGSSVLSLRDLDAGTEVEFALAHEYGEAEDDWGFVISKSAPGARLWICDSNALDLVIDGAREPLATDVNCETVTQSGMHSLLAYATLDDEVMLADTDTLELSPSGLVGFEFDETFEIGDRRDALKLSTTGPYLTHIINTVQDSDGAAITYPVGEVVFDVEHGVELASVSDVFGVNLLLTLQAAVFGAPLFILVDNGALSVAVDGVAKPIAEGTNSWRVRPTAAGPVYVLDEQGELARISGPAFATHEVVLTADSANEGYELSSSGEYGAADGETDVCATPACASKLFALRRFGPDGPLPPLLGAKYWWIAQVFDDGAVLALGAPVDGPFDAEVTLPQSRLLLIGADGAVLAEHPAAPPQFISAVALADGRVVVALSGVKDNNVNDLVVVDPAEATIEPYPGIDASTLDTASLEVDALGRRIVIHYYIGHQRMVAWGELQ